MFEAYYDQDRFAYIHDELTRRRLVRYRGGETIRKTACLYGSNFNVYIDTSDGVNADFPVPEYAGRMLRVIEDAGGKPFIYLKSIYSPVKTRPLIELAAKHGGAVKPFILWHNNPDWYKRVLPKKEKLRRRQREIFKEYDIGMAANLTGLRYPKPNADDPRVSWQDHENFGLGSGEDTGWFKAKTRQRLHEQLRASRFSYFFTEKLPYRDFIQESFKWRAVVCPPGIGDYSLRIYDAASLGQAVLMRKTAYDYAYSWKPYFAEIDFEASNWEDKVGEVVKNYQEWGEKAADYFDTYLTPSAIVDLLEREIELV